MKRVSLVLRSVFLAVSGIVCATWEVLEPFSEPWLTLTGM